MKLIIDSFAGGGGASTGIEAALGRSPDVAINHDTAALLMHKANHPETIHLDSNIWEVEPRDVAAGRPVGLLWASPDCKHFSKAKGGAPVDRNIRDLAWIVVKWAEEVKPDVILMENVEEFLTWGPIGEDGQPIKEFSGITFDLWIKRLRRAGYKVQWRQLRGCDYGAPTIRRRFFMVARRDGRPIAWPKPTHGAQGSREVQRGKLLPYRMAADCIDWSLPCPSIFDTSNEIREKHGLQAKRPLAENTLARIARGMKRYVLDSERPFIVNLTHGGRAEDLADPFRTITGANRGEKAVVAPYVTRFNGGATGQDFRDPLQTVTANSFIKRPGGAPPMGIVAPLLATFYGHCNGRGKRAADLAEPLRTVTVENRHALISPSLLSLKGTTRRDGPATEPHPTVLAGGYHSALVAPVLTYAQQGGGSRSAVDPHHTICASRKDQNSLLAATIIQTGYGERRGQAPRSLDPEKPLGTAVACGTKYAATSAFLAQHNKAKVGFNPGRSMSDPLSTVTATGSQQSVVAPWFVKYYRTAFATRADEPAHTSTSRNRFAHVQAELEAPNFSDEHKDRARAVADLLRRYGHWGEEEFVTVEIGGARFVIVDIGMRMLSPRELFNAQGFPPDYVIEGVWEECDGDWTWKPFTKSTQISCCGNSVCPDVAEALVSANCAHLSVNSSAPKHVRGTA